MKKCKQAYYEKCFERYWNTWKGIKSLISLKIVVSNVPIVLSFVNGDIITNPYDIANSFNNYFVSIAETTDKEEIANSISSLNSNKTSAPNSIPDRILFLLKNEISKQLGDLLNLSLTTCVFPSVLKTEKVVPVYSKLDYGNYRPISLLSSTEKILEKIMYKRLHTFLNNNDIIYKFGLRQKYSNI